jgi:hypothetical protein
VGSTSTKSNSKVRGLTVPSLSALLFPWVRVTVVSFGSATVRILSAAGAGNSGNARDRIAHPCGRNVPLDHVAGGLNTRKWCGVRPATQKATTVSIGGQPG